MASDRLDRWCGEDRIAAVDTDGWALTYGRTQRNVSFCRRQLIRGPWWLRKASGIRSGPGPEEEESQEEGPE